MLYNKYFSIREVIISLFININQRKSMKLESHSKDLTLLGLNLHFKFILFSNFVTIV